MRIFVFISSFVLLVLASTSVKAQVYGSNTFELQYGNLPFEDDRELTTSYDQLNLFYDHDKISFYGRIEHFLTPKNDRNYLELTQKRFQYQDDNFRVRVGNFYETLGRGLLLRSYDIPGSVYEDAYDRTRYAFNRDLEGAAIGYTNNRIQINLLRAKPLLNTFAPNTKPDSLRRPDLIDAVQTNFFLTEDITLGGIFMRSQTDGFSGSREFGSFLFDANVIEGVSVFGEYAFNTTSKLFSFNAASDYALYLGTNFYYNSLGGSLEYKNYQNFRLGAGYNDPPSLIKEHTYPLLNRSTHVLETSDETGIQAEAYYNFEGGHSITLNYTTATNEVFKKFEYREYFVEGYYVVDNFLSFKGFLDFAKDDLKGEENRITFGIITDKTFDYTWGLALDLQYQTFDRSFEPDRSQNYYASLAFSYLPDLTLSVVVEASSDPQETDDPTTTVSEVDTRFWLGGNVAYKFNSDISLDLFAGKRRGGPACTSGICYEILDFEGVELRFSTRF